MNDISSSADAGLGAQVAWAFAAGGPLSEADPAYRERTAQQQLAESVAMALQERGALVAEAGTGVGKTFGYLVPLLLSGCRALVSTATKSLQDQLFLRDLPRLCDALAVPVKLALLKGRASYLCLHRLEQARHSAQLPDRFALRTLARIEAWAQATVTGDLAEIEGLDERSPVIPLVTSTRDNCLGTECPQFQRCHVVKARRDAMAADVVVVNHHLFFADMALRDSGVAELLPTVDAAVFDEAHQLAEAGVHFLGTMLGTGQVLDFARDMLAAGLQHARGLVPWSELAAACDRAARELRMVAAGPSRDLRGAVKLRWDERGARADFVAAVSAVCQSCMEAAEALETVSELAPDFPRLEQRAQQLATMAQRFEGPCPDGRVRWIDVTSGQARLAESPLDIRDMLGEERARAAKAWIFTSATLGDDAELSWFTVSAGLEDARKLKLDSPFDYTAHARLWVPQRFPKPNEAGHPEAVADLASRLAAALHGRTFVLTTTLRALDLISAKLREALRELGAELQVLTQGESPKRTLMQRFMSQPKSVLVGSQSFWEGIDVPGDALQCVIIDKLPFPPPNDPLVEARVKQLQAQGRNAFMDYFVAEAAIALKQGAGRLIRSETDRGLLVVCDPRMAQMHYGKRLRGALPPMTPVQTETDALEWLKELADGREAGVQPL
ncbi:MAG TPA: ATP-dependent DNA helicase [Burkholderiaceae bacterium]|nr:ATP-dependent DNA helicase [Burkholderiaceae bacterium]